MADETASLSRLAEGDDDLEMLRRLRVSIAIQLEETESGRDMAALSKQFTDITREIRLLEKSRGAQNRRTALDDARNKRRKRAKR